MTDHPKNLTAHHGAMGEFDREAALGQRGRVLWMTGLSGSGKSTIAHAAAEALVREGKFAYVLDGDNIRLGLNSDLGFSPEDRSENIRRVSELGKLFADAGVITIVAFISPYREDRQRARTIIGESRFAEVFVDTPLGVCEKRDPKGLYQRARAGKIPEFTGISAPYEPPENAEIVLATDGRSIEESVETLLSHLR